MEKKLFIVFETDLHHSKSHNEMKGCFDSIDEAIEAVCENHEIPKSNFEALGYEINSELDAQDIIREELWELRQTQCFDVNYIIEETVLNEWN